MPERAGHSMDGVSRDWNAVPKVPAFESTMRTILDRKGWPYDKTAPAKPLIAALVNSGHIPASLQDQFARFRELLESGVPTIRNKNGGHGQGEEPVEVPRELAEYALHLTAANIVLLVARI